MISEEYIFFAGLLPTFPFSEARPTEPLLVAIGPEETLRPVAKTFPVLPAVEAAQLIPWLTLGKLSENRFLIAYHVVGSAPADTSLAAYLETFWDADTELIAIGLPTHWAPNLVRLE